MVTESEGDDIYAPDADVLLSESFAERLHCFQLACAAALTRLVLIRPT